jgi:hypothetical protein
MLRQRFSSSASVSLMAARSSRYAKVDDIPMALMLGALHDALTSAGADPDLRAKAEEAAGYEHELAGIRADLLLLNGWSAPTSG